jgi:hypothetical protein
MIDDGRSRWSWLRTMKPRDLAARRLEAVLSSIEAGGFIVQDGGDERSVPWSAVQRIVAANSVGYLGDRTMLIIELPGEEVFIVFETAPVWRELVAAIEATFLAEVPAAWQVRLIATPDLHVELYRRQPTGN